MKDAAILNFIIFGCHHFHAGFPLSQSKGSRSDQLLDYCFTAIIMDLKRTFCVGTWNIRGIREDGKLSEIEKVLKRRNVDELIKFGF